MEFRLKELLDKHKLSCRKLEKILNIPNAKLNKYCKNLAFPTVERAVVIVDYFDVSLDNITGLSNFSNFNLKPANIEIFKIRLEELIKQEKSQVQFFKKCGIDRSNLIRWRKSNTFPKITNLYLIAKNTNTSLDYLVGRTDKNILRDY